MFASETKLRVRYAETDQMGVVYNGNYSTYYEVGRVEALREAGFSYKAMEDMGVMMPVLESHSKYLRPARYDEELIVKVTIPTLPTLKIFFQYEIYNTQNELIHTGDTTLVFINKETKKPCRMPKPLLHVLGPHFDA